MNIQTFLVDLDGVVLHRNGYFSARSRELYPDANHAAILDFFTGGTYKDITLGKQDLVETLAEALPGWSVDRTVDEVLKDWFDGENNIDRAVLDRIQEIRQSGIKCVIATDHSSYRKNQVWNELGMKEYFDDIVASADVGATKHDPEFYIESLKRLNIMNAQDVAFTDDDQKNIDVALSVGLRGFLFKNVDSLSLL